METPDGDRAPAQIGEHGRNLVDPWAGRGEHSPDSTMQRVARLECGDSDNISPQQGKRDAPPARELVEPARVDIAPRPEHRVRPLGGLGFQRKGIEGEYLVPRSAGDGTADINYAGGVRTAGARYVDPRY